MAGLKLNTTTVSPNASASNPASTSTRPIPPPAQPSSSFSAAPPASQPSSTPSSSAAQSHPRPRQPQPSAPPPAHAHAQTKPRNASFTQSDPDAPPHSPITPPLQPLKSTTPIPPPTIPPNFASLGGRAPLTHNSHPATVPSAPLPPVPLDPIDFEDNVDVIALRTAINILQMQKRRAETDIRQLRDVKEAAAADPMMFYKDLMEGRVGKGVPATGQAEDDSDTDSDSSGSDANDTKGVKMEEDANGESSSSGVGALQPSLMEGKASASTKGKGKDKGTATDNGASSSTSSNPPIAAPPWTAKFPEAQNIYRCPPINWSQYAVEGEALEKLHHEQQTRPILGTPAMLGANGTYEFTGMPNADDGKKVEGIAAPFDPFRDKLMTKPKGGGLGGGLGGGWDGAARRSA